MSFQKTFGGRVKGWILFGCLAVFIGLNAQTPVGAQSNVTVRVMSANITSGNGQSYEISGINIFQGLKPDIVAIQEFRYNSSHDSNDLRTLVNTAFGTNFSFYCEPGYNIPNGIVSRWPIISSGTVPSPEVGDRGFAWARIDLPGTNDLYVISVHLYGSGSASQRNNEAMTITNLIGTNSPAGAWVIVGGDFNTDSRSEACVTTFKTLLSDSPIPADNNGNYNTSEPRSKPYDYALPSFSLTNYQTPVVLTSHTFSNGLVFDSAVYTPLSDVSPVTYVDSHTNNMQHMAVIKDFLIYVSGTNSPVTNAPSIITPPQSQTVATGSNAVFTVTADGTAPLAYQWRFNDTNLSGANANMLVVSNAQFANAGNYSVLVTNIAGSVTSSVAVLTVSNFPPVVLIQPQSQTVNVGASATFTVSAGGALPLSYQWRFNGTNSIGTNTNIYTLNNAQATNAGDYSVVITNAGGSITSAVAVLTVNSGSMGTVTTLAGWDTSTLSSFGPSPMSPTTNAPNLTIVGLTRGSGVTTTPTAAARAWGGNGFDSTSSTAAISAGDYATFSISNNAGYTISFTAISRFDYRRSPTGPPNGVLQYQIGSGTFTNIANLSYPTINSGAPVGAIDLSGIAALQNIGPSNVVTFRIVNYGASGSGGNWYIYDTASSTAPDFVVQGIINSTSSSTNPPAAPAVLSAPNFDNGQFQMLVTGSAGSNYVMQASTNLATTNWIPLFTNVSPYIFTDMDLTAPQKFYRAMVQP